MWKIAFILFVVVLAVCLTTASVVAIVHFKRQGLRPALSIKLPKQSFLLRILWELPWQIVNDAFHRQDYEFCDNGFHLIVGEQGSGKTITLVWLLMQYQKQYPKLKVRTNMGYAYEDGTIRSWRDLVFVNNGVYGQIDVLDEVQNWFNSLQSKDFPVEMFQEITQQRKQRKMIIGTSQVWQRVAKPIREQVKYVYKPITLLGCLTIVRKFKPVVNDEGAVDELKPRGIFFFVHNDELRNAFDTYKKIQVMSLKGFKPQAVQAVSPYDYSTSSPTSGDEGKK